MTDKRNDCNFSNNIMTNENNYYNLDKITDEKRASALRKKTDVLTAKIRSVINISQLHVLRYYLILIALGWVPVTSSTCPFPTDLENLPCDVTVFENDTAEFQYYSTSRPVSVRINGTKIHQLDEALKQNLEFDTSNEPYYTLVVKQTNLEYNNTIVGFRDDTGAIRNASLFIQGTLTRPTHLRCQKSNATNVYIIEWDDPPSLLGHANTTYVVVLYFIRTNTTYTVNSSSLTFITRAEPINISVTGWNQVGEGAAAYFDLTVPTGCPTIDPTTEDDENDQDTNLPSISTTEEDENGHDTNLPKIAGGVGPLAVIIIIAVISGIILCIRCYRKNQREQVSQPATSETTDSNNQGSQLHKLETGRRWSGRQSLPMPVQQRNTSDVHADENRSSTNPQHQPTVFSDKEGAPMPSNEDKELGVIKGVEEGVNMYPQPRAEQSQGYSTTMV